MLTLYTYTSRSRADRIIWALTELNFDYQIKALNPMVGEHLSAEYLAINPTGKVPTLVHEVDGNKMVFSESVAILEYLNDLHPDKPLSIDVTDADYAIKNFYMRQALSYGMAEIENYAWVCAQDKILPHYTWATGTAEECLKRIEKALPVVAQWLVERDYIAGDSFTFADIYYFQLLGWIKMLGVALPEHVSAYRKKLTQREKFPEQFKKK